MGQSSEPFLYPKSRHLRLLTPGPYANYRSYKPHLANEFRARCVYCRMPSSIKGDESFGVDHYRPQKHFPALATDYANLFYACNICNSRKGSYWPLKGGPLIPNPCQDEMTAHLRYDGAQVVTRTLEGACAAKLLDLNDPAQVAYRERLLGSIRGLMRELQRIRDLRKGAAPDALSELQEEEAEVVKSLQWLGAIEAKITLAT